MPDPKPHHGEPVIIGVDRNVWNISTPDHVIVPPQKMIRSMENAENTASRAQRIADRRQKPDRTLRKPGSRRWAKAAKRVARQKRRAANLRHTIVQKASSVVANNSTHAVLEELPLQNMTKSAKGTKENPGTNVSQKSGLNKAILYQCWGMLARLLEYKLAGHVLWVVAAYTSQTCSMCGFADKKNRNGRVFLCLSCLYLAHADRNAARNIEDAGICNLGRPARRGKIALRAKHTISDFPATLAGSAHVKGRLDAEGSCVSSPMNRQTPTGMWPSGTVTLWHDV